jgi:ribosomal protein L11 methyltransferase
VKNKPQKLYQIKIFFSVLRPGQAQLISLLLQKAGVRVGDIVFSSDGSTDSLAVFKSSLKEARQLKKKVLAWDLKNIEISLKSLKDKDWLIRWKDNFNPFNITRNIRIVPFKFKGRIIDRPGQLNIFIDTDTVFGTGMHPTTRFMVEFVQKEAGRFKDFFDIGTGTGILAIIAHKFGAKKIWGIDIDKKSIPVARENILANSGKFDYLKAQDFKTLEVLRKFDFVAANLLTDDLIKMRDKIVSTVKPEKYLAVSGISAANWTRFNEHFNQKPLKCLKILSGEGWCAALYKVNK